MDTELQNRTVPHPFNDPNADIVLQTCEEEEEAMAKCAKCKRKIPEFREMREELAEFFDSYVHQVCTVVSPYFPMHCLLTLFEEVTFDTFWPEASVRT